MDNDSLKTDIRRSIVAHFTLRECRNNAENLCVDLKTLINGSTFNKKETSKIETLVSKLEDAITLFESKRREL